MATASSGSSLYNRIGGYDVIAALVDEYLDRLMADPAMARFKAARSSDSRRRTRQLSIDYLSEKAATRSLAPSTAMREDEAAPLAFHLLGLLGR